MKTENFSKIPYFLERACKKTLLKSQVSAHKETQYVSKAYAFLKLMNFLDLRKFLRLTVLVLTYFDSVMGYLNWVNFGVYRGWKIILIRSIIIKQHFCDREIRVRGWKRNWISRVMQSISWKSFNIIKLKTDAWQAEYILIMIFS